ncbi:hypothetical protein [Enterococcus phage vB_EfaS_Ef2.2]|nr:hypothetical protein [Enterococcus phage vB_EfaS_Ef2.2]
MDMKDKLKLTALWILLGVSAVIALVEWLLPLLLLKRLL